MTHLRSNSKVRKVVKAGFADKLKDVCFQMYSWAGLMPAAFYEEPGNAHLKEVVLPKLGKTPRQVWIAVGNGVRDWVFELTWVEFLLLSPKCDFLIVSDMRFPVEAERIKSLGGTVVKVVRPDVPHTSDAADDPLMSYTGWDHTIVNVTGEMNEFYGEVVSVVEDMLNGSSVRP